MKYLPIILFLFLFSACNKDHIACTKEKEFCKLIANKNFDGTETLINDFLAKHFENDSAKDLENLGQWLECKSCVKQAKILCNSCVKTYPALSELSIDYISKGEIINKVLDIKMVEPLEFGFHHK